VCIYRRWGNSQLFCPLPPPPIYVFQCLYTTYVYIYYIYTFYILLEIFLPGINFTFVKSSDSIALTLSKNSRGVKSIFNVSIIKAATSNSCLPRILPRKSSGNSLPYSAAIFLYVFLWMLSVSIFKNKKCPLRIEEYTSVVYTLNCFMEKLIIYLYRQRVTNFYKLC
jgi:hypothetical protein